jgi:hypothetical protein
MVAVSSTLLSSPVIYTPDCYDLAEAVRDVFGEMYCTGIDIVSKHVKKSPLERASDAPLLQLHPSCIMEQSVLETKARAVKVSPFLLYDDLVKRFFAQPTMPSSQPKEKGLMVIECLASHSFTCPILAINWPAFLGGLYDLITTRFVEYSPTKSVVFGTAPPESQRPELPLALWAFIDPILHAYSPHLSVFVEQLVLDALATFVPNFAHRIGRGRPGKHGVNTVGVRYQHGNTHAAYSGVSAPNTFLASDIKDIRLWETFRDPIIRSAVHASTALTFPEVDIRVCPATAGLSKTDYTELSLAIGASFEHTTLLALNPVPPKVAYTPTYSTTSNVQNLWVARSRTPQGQLLSSVLSLEPLRAGKLSEKPKEDLRDYGVCVVPNPHCFDEPMAIMSIFHTLRYLNSISWRHNANTRPSVLSYDAYTAAGVIPPLKAVDFAEFPLKMYSVDMTWTDSTAAYVKAVRHALILGIPTHDRTRAMLVYGNAKGSESIVATLHASVEGTYPASALGYMEGNLNRYYWAFPLSMLSDIRKGRNNIYAARLGYKYGEVPFDGSTKTGRSAKALAVCGSPPNTKSRNAPRVVTLTEAEVYPVYNSTRDNYGLPSADKGPCPLYIKQYKGVPHIGIPAYLQLNPAIYRGNTDRGDTSRLRNGVFYNANLDTYFVDFWVFMHASWHTYEVLFSVDTSEYDYSNYTRGLPMRYLAQVYKTSDATDLTNFNFYAINRFIPSLEVLDVLIPLAWASLEGYGKAQRGKGYKNKFTEWFMKTWSMQTYGDGAANFELLAPANSVADRYPLRHSAQTPKRKYDVWTPEQDAAIVLLYRPGISYSKLQELRRLCGGTRSAMDISVRATYLLKKVVVEQHIFDYSQLPHNRYSAKTKKWISEQEAAYKASR